MAANDVHVTLVGIVGKVGELRQVGKGDRQSALTTIRMVVTPRTRDESGEWKDDEDNAIWYAVKAWRRLAENAVESFKPGDRIIVKGRLQGRSFTTKDGTEVSANDNLEVDADYLGHEIGFNAAVSQRKPRNGGGNGGGASSSANRSSTQKKTVKKNDDLDFDMDEGLDDEDF